MEKMYKLMAYFFGIVYISFSGMLMFGANGSAYVDPSVMTYMIQIIAGVVIAVGAVVGVYWRRAKKKVQNTLGFEEKKEHESDEIVVDQEFDAADEKAGDQH